MNRVLTLYRNAYGGLSRPAWMLAMVMFINRSGAMVVPFLSVYLTEALGFSLKQAGLALSAFGLGSMCGSFLGGWLTDRVGHFRVQFYSLILGGSFFFMLLQLKSFLPFVGGLFILSLITECLRPANSSSVAFYAKPENLTRAFSLNRMAINLGFSIGPAIGGLLATISYQWLFMADGITCILAGLFFYFYFNSRKGYQPKIQPEKTVEKSNSSPYQDYPYLVFAFLCTCFAVVFFQFFTTLPLYYRQVYVLSEARIGTLLGLNGFIVFLFEMILIYLIGQRISFTRLIVSGILLNGFSFILLNLVYGQFVLFIAMLLLSMAEIFAMPFMATITVNRSNDHNRGAYMGLYSLSYSAAHILAPYLGTSIVAAYGFTTLWWLAGIFSVLTAIGFMVITPKLNTHAPAV
ncbi:MFS transporter [Adhaeribacter aerolatus]|uniref:MFS transporter n=1 Tax=Adhaeribacter aerolatus TaxID=670289 RepID=A0A512B4V5_9BACT|nr:MFS transporter [Adhaeribacter aerolatus]GEO06817.1 MFS transporter [Adhaeribacter aerolatus]